MPGLESPAEFCDRYSGDKQEVFWLEFGGSVVWLVVFCVSDS